MTDTDYPSITICNSKSHQALASEMGLDLSKNRWRGNLWIDDLDPWTEMDWIGKIVQIGTPEEIYENPNSIYVSQRLGSPKINILPGSLFKLDNNIPKIGLRPENIELGDGPYEGKVVSIENLGSETVVAISFKDNEILASIQGSYKSSINEKINLNCHEDHQHFFDSSGLSIF